MKAEGIEYEERMELLEEVTWPQPLGEELLFPAFETYRAGHPWVSEFALSPKSVVRDMVERSMTFTEFVSHYGLSRTEGLVLRYLTDAYRALRQTVPDSARTEELHDLTEWLGELIRGVDSSLLDEWEQLQNPSEFPVVPSADEAVRPITANTRSFRVLVRNALFRRVQLAARGRWDELDELDPDVDWAGSLEDYFSEHDEIGTGPDARGPELFQVDQAPGVWRVRQVLADPAEDHDWAVRAEVDLAASDEAGEVVLAVTGVQRM